MNANDRLSKLEERAQALLQESAERLDGRTRSRLTQARHEALAVINQRQTRTWQWLVPLSGATATAVIAAIMLMSPGRHHVEQAAAMAADELEIVTAEDSLEFYRDVEFYAWLDSVLDDAGAEDSGA